MISWPAPSNFCDRLGAVDILTVTSGVSTYYEETILSKLAGPSEISKVELSTSYLDQQGHIRMRLESLREFAPSRPPFTPTASVRMKSGRGGAKVGVWWMRVRKLELFPTRCTHLVDKEMRRNNEIERACRSHLIGIRSSGTSDTKGSSSLSIKWPHTDDLGDGRGEPIDVVTPLDRACLAGPCDPGSSSLAQPISAGGRIPRIAWTEKHHDGCGLRKDERPRCRVRAIGQRRV